MKILKKNDKHESMGVRRLFSRGGENFPGGGQKHTFSSKTTYYFWMAKTGKGRGEGPLLTPMN
jgi:hypothetical protein